MSLVRDSRALGIFVLVLIVPVKFHPDRIFLRSGHGRLDANVPGSTATLTRGFRSFRPQATMGNLPRSYLSSPDILPA